VTNLRAELNARGIKSKVRISRDGAVRAVWPTRAGRSRGRIWMRTRCFRIGSIWARLPIRGSIYPGKHEPIIARAVWEQVQNQLAANRHAPRERHQASAPSLLTGLLAMQPTTRTALRARSSTSMVRKWLQTVPHGRQTDLREIVMSTYKRWFPPLLGVDGTAIAPGFALGDKHFECTSYSHL
jgi:hypothetical protein